MSPRRSKAGLGIPDANQAAIVARLEQVGATVMDLHGVGRGCPDLLVGFQGRNLLMEVKREDGGRLEDSQKVFMATWRGQKALVRTPDEAMALLGVRG